MITPENGIVSVDVSDIDPSVYDVHASLQRILSIDMSKYDFMLGGYRMTESMLLADFELTDGHSSLSMISRTSVNEEANEDCTDTTCHDPVEDYSPNMSETDPIECTPLHHDRKLKQNGTSKKLRAGVKRTSNQYTSSDRFRFPKWR